LAPLPVPEQRLAETRGASLDFSARQPLEGGFGAVQPPALSGNGTRKIPAAFGKKEQLETLRDGRQEACEEGPVQAMHEGNHANTAMCFSIVLSPRNLLNIRACLCRKWCTSNNAEKLHCWKEEEEGKK